jgi:ribosomal protein S27AE
MPVNITTLNQRCPRCGRPTLTDVITLVNVGQDRPMQPVPVSQSCSHCGYQHHDQ